MQNIFNLRTAPTVNGLIVVPYRKQVFMRGRKVFDNFILHFIRVLKLVYENISKSAAEVFKGFFIAV